MRNSLSMSKSSTFMEPAANAWIYNDRLTFCCLMLFGSCLITLCSFAKIPFYPVSFTLQTFAIFILALTQSPKQAFTSVFCYLFAATVGLPVFAGHSNPFWIMGKCGGYLIAFPFAAYLTARIAQKSSAVVAILSGQMLIYVCGFLWLMPIFGFETSFIKGVLIFIPSDIIKNIAAIATASIWRKYGR